MKILHTSDWHIGKQLYKQELHEDLLLFFDWLLQYIVTEKIDVLLVSGDVFDHANPSQAAFKQYYDFLKRLIPLDLQVIITGGNHDSSAVLNAPAELLRTLNITVIGGAGTLDEMFIPINKNSERIVIAAIPYLRDKDLRKPDAGETYTDKIELAKAALRTYFSEVNAHYSTYHKEAFYVLMGHLYVQGSQLSDSERDIQIGNLAGVEVAMFEGIPHYVALGHIHKPQVISAKHQIHYCGSPIPLSFSEKEDRKQVNLIEVENNRLKSVKKIEIPTFRKLVSFEGTLSEVKEKITQYTDETPLLSFAEIKVIEEQESIENRYAFETFVTSNPNEKLQIVKSRLIYKNLVEGASHHFAKNTDVADVTPLQMFEKRLELEPDLENKEALLLAFRELLEELGL